MQDFIKQLLKTILSSIRDITPILLVVLFFQIVVLGNPLGDLTDVFLGLILVVSGLALFIFGLELGLFPIGETIAINLVNKANVAWLIIFAFLLGFGTTFAEPALVAVANEAAEVAFLDNIIAANDRINYATNLRQVVASSVGFAIVLGVLRILYGWSIRYILLTGYLLIVLITFFAPNTIIGIAYDAGGVTTSTVTVPLVAALGIGLARGVKGRNPMLDGFGIIALASLAPIIFVLFYGIII